MDADLRNAYPPPAASARHHPAWPRGLRHALALAAAALVAWLVFRSYGQPGFLLDFVNLRLC